MITSVSLIGDEGFMKKRKCHCCWKESEDDSNWIYFKFKHLKPVWVCVECRPKWNAHMLELQAKGF